MKLEIFEEDSEQTIRLKLNQPGTGGVALDAVDSKGDMLPHGRILHIDTNGKCFFHPDVGDFGLCLDHKKRIVLGGS